FAGAPTSTPTPYLACTFSLLLSSCAIQSTIGTATEENEKNSAHADFFAREQPVRRSRNGQSARITHIFPSRECTILLANRWILNQMPRRVELVPGFNRRFLVARGCRSSRVRSRVAASTSSSGGLGHCSRMRAP